MNDIDNEEQLFETPNCPLEIAVSNGFFQISCDKKPIHKYAVISHINGTVRLYATFKRIGDAKKIINLVDHDPIHRKFSLFVVQTNCILKIGDFDRIDIINNELQ